MNLTILIILLSFLFLPPSMLAAKEVEVWHGWMNLQPCTTVEWNGPIPEFYTYTHELHGWIHAEVNDPGYIIDQVRNDAINCGIRAAAVTTTVAILTDGLGGWEIFSAEFYSCMESHSQSYQFVTNLRFTSDTFCGD